MVVELFSWGGYLGRVLSLGDPGKAWEENLSYDAVVIGGGVVGVATAYELVRLGVKTILIDRQDVGRATDAGAGIISAGEDPNHPDPYYRFVGLAELHYKDLVRNLEADGAEETGYAVCGSLWVAIDERETAEFNRSTYGLPEGDGTSDGPVLVTPDRAREIFPPLGDVKGAVYSPSTARVDGRQLASALESAALSRGLEKRSKSVETVSSDGNVSTITMDDGETVEAGNVVIAGGAWSEAFSDQLSVDIPVGPQRGQIVHLDVGDVDTSSWPILTGLTEHYMVSWPDQRVVVGATREADVGYNPVTSVEGVIEVLYEAIRVAPSLKSAMIREIRVGLRPLSRDGMPIVGTLPGHKNVQVVTGHGSMGLHLGPYSGKVVADAVATGTWPYEMAAFGVERFM